MYEKSLSYTSWNCKYHIIFIFHIFGHVRPIHIHRQTSTSL